MSKWGRYDFCNLEPKKNWEQGFEDKLNCVLKVDELIKTYVGWHSKVKIKVKDGCIQIEKIK